LARRGASVAITYQASSERADKLVADLEGGGRSAFAVHADHCNDQSTIAAVHAVSRRFGQIDIVVNNAGIFAYGPIDEAKLHDLDCMLALYARAPFLAIQTALPFMPSGGRIISIGSTLADHVPTSGLSLYSMAKASLAGLTKALARELGARGITVNLVSPGSMDTDMNPAAGPQAETELMAIPAGRYGNADEIADVVAFLASPAAAFVNGANISVDGGATA
jgi:NAD(P)-dependent dehydrogenase (short-subunit alcohol dehydrogenase family)